MIIDLLTNVDLYVPMHPHFQAAAAFLRRADLASLPDGKHEIIGTDVYAIVSHGKGRGRLDSPLEAHRHYVDIHYIAEGEELIGYSPLPVCKIVREAYIPDRDIEFYNDAPQSWLQVKPGMFALCYPQDAHAPLAGQGPHKKIVVKVKV